MKTFRFAVEILGWFVCAATFLPFIRTAEWWVRIFDFPRLQLFLFVILLLIVLVWQWAALGNPGKVLVAVLGLAMVAQLWHIIPYTPVARKQVKPTSAPAQSIRVFVANVLQENRTAHELMAQIQAAEPDIILLNEMDDWWAEQMKMLDRSHPHTVLHPRTNTYGMNLYSKFELEESEVRFLTDPDVPSIRTIMKLPGNRLLHFYGVHPKPPGTPKPKKAELNDSEQRDAELVIVAKEVANLEEPVIVAGDFNDVAWSHTTRLFQRISRLLDPRVGRGMFNSYHAKVPIFRYPLDHLFHSDHFTLDTMELGDDFGSDHFPVFVSLTLQPLAAEKQEAPPQKPKDRKEAQEILKRREEE